MSQQLETEEREAARQRDLAMPQTYSSVLEGVTPLDVCYRLARFLNEDGDTRTEIYWRVDPNTLPPAEDQVAVVRQLGLTGYPHHLLRLVALGEDVGRAEGGRVECRPQP